MLRGRAEMVTCREICAWPWQASIWCSLMWKQGWALPRHVPDSLFLGAHAWLSNGLPGVL